MRDATAKRKLFIARRFTIGPSNEPISGNDRFGELPARPGAASKPRDYRRGQSLGDTIGRITIAGVDEYYAHVRSEIEKTLQETGTNADPIPSAGSRA
jgi:hypothetical protein